MKNSIKKRALAFIMGTIVYLSSNNASAVFTNDFVITNSDTNISLSNNEHSYTITNVPSNTKCYRIFQDDNKSLVYINGVIGYVSNFDINFLNNNYQNVCIQEEYSDLAICNVEKLNIRQLPSIDSTIIKKIKKHDIVEVLGKTSNDFLLVRFDGKIGYITKDYVKSLKYSLKDTYPELNDCSIKKVGKVKQITYLYKDLNANDTIRLLDANEIINIIDENEIFYLVYNSDGIGYLLKNDVEILNDLFVVIDISDQHIQMYKDNEIIIDGNVTTGSDSNPTPIGEYKPRCKENVHYIEKYDCNVDHWVRLKGNYGMHGYKQKIEFGSQKYHKYGSHGCVRVEDNTIDRIYSLLEVNKTPVYIKR